MPARCVIPTLACRDLCPALLARQPQWFRAASLLNHLEPKKMPTTTRYVTLILPTTMIQIVMNLSSAVFDTWLGAALGRAAENPMPMWNSLGWDHTPEKVFATRNSRT